MWDIEEKAKIAARPERCQAIARAKIPVRHWSLIIDHLPWGLIVVSAILAERLVTND
jgi:hypothetical protein